MTVTITEKEFKALHFAITQIETAMEAADEDYTQEATIVLHDLYSISAKYLKKREDAMFFQSVRMEVSRHNRNMRPRDIDALTRRLVKKLKATEK